MFLQILAPGPEGEWQIGKRRVESTEWTVEGRGKVMVIVFAVAHYHKRIVLIVTINGNSNIS